ncbi:MAG: site-specific DNA-methyltransferase [Propionibacteriaceae bacterium]|jgi:site-specific DNA-methyltransferase (adenine-specific)|nr:site-specific DNA-methyltransferase [Propionibacteriaceae bacterium]
MSVEPVSIEGNDDETAQPQLFIVPQDVKDVAVHSDFCALTKGFQPQVTASGGTIFQGDSIAWLMSLPDVSVDMVFADPPYNIGKADWDNFESQQHYVDWSMEWIEQASRILQSHGVLYICGFSEVLADLRLPSSRYFASCRWLVWHYRNKANLSSNWGRSHESILCLYKRKPTKLQNVNYLRIPYGAHTLKYPEHPQADTSNFSRKSKPQRELWSPHPMGAKPKDVIEVPTTCNGMGEKTPHPTQKPEELVRKFVFASTDRGDVVLDPFSGSGTTAVVSEQLSRRWLACDLDARYNSWAAERLRNVRRLSERQWFDLDRENVLRRESIR